MFDLIFGGFWTLFTAFMTFAFYGGFGGGTISVNGVPVSQAEFNAMLWPKLFFAIFWIVGLSMLFKGLKKLFANVATSSLGEETIGYVADIIDSGCYVNGNPVWNAKITFIDNTNKIKTVTESIGMNYDKYFIQGQVQTMADEAYTSHNTNRLDVEGTVKKLLTTDYVQNALKN